MHLGHWEVPCQSVVQSVEYSGCTTMFKLTISPDILVLVDIVPRSPHTTI